MKTFNIRQYRKIPKWSVAILALLVVLSPSLLFIKQPVFFLSLHLAQIVIILGIYLLMNYYGLFILLSIYGLYVLGVHITNIIYQQNHKAINNME